MLTTWKKKIDGRLSRLIPPGTPPALAEAMIYSLEAGGKRFRPLLSLATAHSLGANADLLVDAACALEYIHTYSLIHDDLPAMDDDDLRRGRPTSHIAHGEALAILAGDALNTQAFSILASRPEAVSPSTRCGAVRILADASGPAGMAGGQALDISDDLSPTRETLAAIHTGKTARLIQASIDLGSLWTIGAVDAALSAAGRDLGLLFQLVDDILDEIASADDMGKRTGKDAGMGKITGVTILGLDEAIRTARSLEEKVRGTFRKPAGDTKPLRDLVTLVTDKLPPV